MVVLGCYENGFGVHLFCGKVRDENNPLIDQAAEREDLILYDHLSVYLGLYDIDMDAYSSPHLTSLVLRKAQI